VTAENGCIVDYIHGGGRIGVIVAAKTETVNDTVKDAMKNIAMQIAALNPKYIDRSEVSAEYIAHEKEILLAQIQNDPKESQKPEKVINGMIEGRVNKELKEICLVDQVYVKAEDGKQTVGKYLEAVSKEVGTTVSIQKFIRFETGEGLEKKNEDFAAEVAAQMNQ
jgi:elongation factor Ts